MPPKVYDVKAITIDDYVRETGVTPSAIKIDAESAEMAILQGMDRVLREVRPAISIEVGDFQVKGVAASADVVGHLVGLGYRPHEWRDAVYACISRGRTMISATCCSCRSRAPHASPLMAHGKRRLASHVLHFSFIPPRKGPIPSHPARCIT